MSNEEQDSGSWFNTVATVELIQLKPALVPQACEP